MSKDKESAAEVSEEFDTAPDGSGLEPDVGNPGPDAANETLLEDELSPDHTPKKTSSKIQKASDIELPGQKVEVPEYTIEPENSPADPDHIALGIEEPDSEQADLDGGEQRTVHLVPSEIVPELRDAMVAELSTQMMNGLEQGVMALNGGKKTASFGRTLQGQKGELMRAFSDKIAANFDSLLQQADADWDEPDYGSLSLVQEDDLEAIIAMDGMIAHSRNSEIRGYLVFTTRLNELFDDMLVVDEANNPMDPQQIGDAFKDALREQNPDAESMLVLFRQFNSSVFNELEAALAKANEVLVQHGVLPEIDVAGRSRARKQSKRAQPREERQDPNERAFSGQEEAAQAGGENSQLFSMMQNLMHTAASQPSVPPQQPGVLQGQGVPVSTVQGQPAAAGSVPGQAAPATMAPGQVAPAGQGVPGAPGQAVNQLVPGQEGAAMAQAPASPGAMAVGGTEGGVVQPLPVIGYDMNGIAGGQFALQPGMMLGSQRVEIVQTEQLNAVLGKLQHSLDRVMAEQGGAGAKGVVDLNSSLGEFLQTESGEEIFSALDGVSSDVINLITMIYAAIWQDESIQIPVKELIGRTQITVLRIALDDADFFDNEKHPGRQLINELATAGISWTEFDKLESDPMYLKMREIVEALVSGYDGDIGHVVTLVDHLRQFKQSLLAEDEEPLERLKDEDARKKRLHDIHDYARKKISERFGNEELHPFVEKFLLQPFHRFVVDLILKEGPNGVSWKPVMNTIDVLLWTVTPGKKAKDIVRFDRLRPRLMQNLQKALGAVGVSEAKTASAIGNLEKIQKHCFKDALKHELEAAEAKREARRRAVAEGDSPAPAVDAEQTADTSAGASPEQAARKKKQGKKTVDWLVAKEEKAPKQPSDTDTAQPDTEDSEAGSVARAGKVDTTTVEPDTPSDLESVAKRSSPEDTGAAHAESEPEMSDEAALLAMFGGDEEAVRAVLGAEEQNEPPETESTDKDSNAGDPEGDVLEGLAASVDDESADASALEAAGIDLYSENQEASAETEGEGELGIDEEVNLEDDDVEFDNESDILGLLEEASKADDLPEGDEHLQQVNKLPIGVWMEFQIDGKNSIRCTLAAKIATIDKYIFVNQKGVKVVDRTRMDLARELKEGTVKIISEEPVVDRAMESVIGKLRDVGQGEAGPDRE